MSRFSGVLRDSPNRLPRQEIDTLTAPGLATPNFQQSPLVRGVQQALVASLGAGSELGQFLSQGERLAASQRAQAEQDQRVEQAASEEARRTADAAEEGRAALYARTNLPAWLQRVDADEISLLPGETPEALVSRVVGAVVPEEASDLYRQKVSEVVAPSLVSAAVGRQREQAEQGRAVARTAVLDSLVGLSDPAAIQSRLSDARSTGLMDEAQERSGLVAIMGASSNPAEVEAIASVLGTRAPSAVTDSRERVAKIAEASALGEIQARIDEAAAQVGAISPEELNRVVTDLRNTPGLRLTERRAVESVVNASQDRVWTYLEQWAARDLDAATASAQVHAGLPPEHPGHLSPEAYGGFLRATQTMQTARAKAQQREDMIRQGSEMVLAPGGGWIAARTGLNEDERQAVVGSAMQRIADEVQQDTARADDDPASAAAAAASAGQRTLLKQFAALEQSAETYAPFTNTVLGGLAAARAANATNTPVPENAVAGLALWRQMPPALRERSFTVADNRVMELADLASQYNFPGEDALALKVATGFTAGSIDRGAIAGADKAFDTGLSRFAGTPEAYELRQRAEQIAAVYVQSGAIGDPRAAAAEATKRLAADHIIVDGHAIDRRRVPAELTETLPTVARMMVQRAELPEGVDRADVTLSQVPGRGWQLRDKASLAPVGPIITDDEMVGVLQNQREADARVLAESTARRDALRVARLPDLNRQLDELDAQIAQVERTNWQDYPGISDRHALLFNLRRQRRELVSATQTLPPDPKTPVLDDAAVRRIAEQEHSLGGSR